MSSVEQDILAALETYQWTPSATVYNFANHLNYSEAYLQRRLSNMVASGDIERIADGTTHGKPRFIYRISK